MSAGRRAEGGARDGTSGAAACTWRACWALEHPFNDSSSEKTRQATRTGDEHVLLGVKHEQVQAVHVVLLRHKAVQQRGAVDSSERLLAIGRLGPRPRPQQQRPAPPHTCWLAFSSPRTCQWMKALLEEGVTAMSTSLLRTSQYCVCGAEGGGRNGPPRAGGHVSVWWERLLMTRRPSMHPSPRSRSRGAAAPGRWLALARQSP